MSDLGWSAPRVDLLRKLWQDGLSASQIAKQLGGVTRNAVIGKVHRLGLSGRAPSRPRRAVFRAPRPARVVSTTPRSPRAPRGPAAASGPAMVAQRQVVPRIEEVPGLATALTLGAHMCRWPIGDPLAEGFTYCGRHAQGSYCIEHAQVAYRPGVARPLHQDPTIRRLLAG